MTREEILLLLDNLRSFDREKEWLEFKKSNLSPKKVGETISALSNGASILNESFGYLVFGIDNNTHDIIGTSRFISEAKIGNEDLESWLIQMLDPKMDFRIYEILLDEKKVSIIKIPAAQSRPVRFQNIAYIRIGSHNKNLKDYPEKERTIWSKDSSNNFESSPAKENISEDDVLELLDYQYYFHLTSHPLPKNTTTIIEKLCEEKIIVQNGRLFNITNLGAILFAKNLDNFDAISRKAIRLIEYKGNNRIETKREYTGSKGYAIGFSSLITYTDMLLPTNEMIKEALRHEVKIYPELALRELIANALIHQDFSVRGTGPMIEIFENRIEITNPGKPLIDVLRFIDHSPRSRNERLAHFMRRLNICEERGSGIDKVIHQCEIFQLPAPDFIESENFTRVKMYVPRTLNQMDKKDRIRACYQHCVLKYVSGESMTNKSLRKRFSIDDQNYSKASRIISDTIAEKLIKYHDPNSDSKKFAKYVPFWVT